MAALAILNEQTKTVTLFAKLFFYGSEAKETIAFKITEEIRTMYHEPKGIVLLYNIPYSINFQIDFEIVSLEQAFGLAYQNTDFRYNFVRIEPQNHVTRSFMGFGLGDNVGHWITS
ncbi:MAG: hypothetical protein ACK41O_15175, partial [Runella zeae]